ncbi:circadian clock-controlled protein daywake [Halictus rubicundus]|uniref:circadian clock-controlled protein daywake n=1 Tax=Halictus rubicundus TaxID=77578 RepID=UPI0040373014
MKITGLILAAVFTVAFARDLPEFLHVCKRNDPQLGDCIKASVENVKPYLLRGVPEYKLPSLEPLKLKELVSTSGNNLNLKLKNVDVYGASNFSVTKIRANIDTLRFVIELDLPNLALEGDYEIDGKVILLRLQGSGPVFGNFTNCKAKVKLQAATTKGKDGQNLVNIVDFKTRIAVGSGHLKLNNLFGGDPALGEAVNVAINSNFDAFIKEIQPSLESAISDTFLQIANSILTQFSYETLFPLS